MKPEWKTRWLAALRGEGEYAGRFPKGKARLCTIEPSGEESYCCLGVLAELLKDAGQMSVVKIVDYDSNLDYDKGRKQKEYDGGAAFLVAKYREITGLTGRNCTDLAGINDNTETFEEVIKEIEKL